MTLKQESVKSKNAGEKSKSTWALWIIKGVSSMLEQFVRSLCLINKSLELKNMTEVSKSSISKWLSHGLYLFTEGITVE